MMNKPLLAHLINNYAYQIVAIFSIYYLFYSTSIATLGYDLRYLIPKPSANSKTVIKRHQANHKYDYCYFLSIFEVLTS